MLPAVLALLAGLAPLVPARGQDMLTAEDALENARDVYSAPDADYVTTCPEETVTPDTGGGDVIVVCRRLGPANRFILRDGPEANMERTATGAPRAPDVSGLPPCHGGPPSCVRLGRVPPPVLMVDVAALPEPLAPDEAAAVFRAPEEGDPVGAEGSGGGDG